MPETSSNSFRRYGHDVLDKMIDEDWRPNNDELIEFIGVSPAYADRIKQAIRTWIAPDDYGIVWGFHPPTGTYRIASRGTGVAREILHFYRNLLAQGVGGYADMVRGAGAAGHVTEASAALVEHRAAQITEQIAGMEELLVFTAGE